MHRTRAYRRERMAYWKRRVQGYYLWYSGLRRNLVGNARVVGVNATTRHPCSGPCCGNPRRWFKRRTRQEMAFLLGLREALQ